METKFYMYTIFNKIPSPSGRSKFERTHYVVGARNIEDARRFIQEVVGSLLFDISPTTLDIIDKLESGQEEGHIVIWI